MKKNSRIKKRIWKKKDCKYIYEYLYKIGKKRDIYIAKNIYTEQTHTKFWTSKISEWKWKSNKNNNNNNNLYTLTSRILMNSNFKLLLI